MSKATQSELISWEHLEYFIMVTMKIIIDQYIIIIEYFPED